MIMNGVEQKIRGQTIIDKTMANQGPGQKPMLKWALKLIDYRQETSASKLLRGFQLYKGVFTNTLVGGGWAIENFCRQTFLTPSSQAAKTF